jgi:hypothetical protein
MLEGGAEEIQVVVSELGMQWKLAGWNYGIFADAKDFLFENQLLGIGEFEA